MRSSNEVYRQLSWSPVSLIRRNSGISALRVSPPLTTEGESRTRNSTFAVNPAEVPAFGAGGVAPSARRLLIDRIFRGILGGPSKSLTSLLSIMRLENG